MKVAAVLGTLNSGKGTFAEVFVKQGNFAPMAFADPMKLFLRDVFKIDPVQLWGTSESRTPRTREMLQTLGTDFARKYDPQVWVNHMDARMQSYAKDGVDNCFNRGHVRINSPGVIITDLRFPNEAQMLIEKYNATIYKIVRPHSRDAALIEHNNHASETAVGEVPREYIKHMVFNTGTREDLLGEAERFLEILCNQ